MKGTQTLLPRAPFISVIMRIITIRYVLCECPSLSLSRDPREDDAGEHNAVHGTVWDTEEGGPFPRGEQCRELTRAGIWMLSNVSACRKARENHPGKREEHEQKAHMLMHGAGRTGKLCHMVCVCSMLVARWGMRSMAGAISWKAHCCWLRSVDFNIKAMETHCRY